MVELIESNIEEKFRSRYRIKSARLEGYDYAQNDAYFITICTRNREHFFGEIVDDVIHLSIIGEIVKSEWLQTGKIRKNIILDEWIIMPNHFHAIIIIDNIVETHCNASLQEQIYKNKFGPQSNNISAIIRGFKGSTTKQIHLAKFYNFSWQSRFYDHVIRDENEFDLISEYIITNPQNWEKDDYFK